MANLAINGGTPIRTEGYPTIGSAAGRTIGAEELANVTEVLQSGMLNRSAGKFVPLVEQKWAEHLGIKHCTVSTSGTAAIIAATESATKAGSRIKHAPKRPACTRSEGQPQLRLISSKPCSAPIRAAARDSRRRCAPGWPMDASAHRPERRQKSARCWRGRR